MMRGGDVEEKTMDEGTIGEDATDPGEDAADGGEAEGRPWPGWGTFADIQDAVGGLVDSAMRNVGPGTSRFPRYDLIEVPETGYVLLLDLPGLEKADVEVTASAGEVTVRGRRERPDLPEGAEVHRSERVFGRFRRSVRVPGDVDIGGIAARMTNGVLEITLPSAATADSQRIRVD